MKEEEVKRLFTEEKAEKRRIKEIARKLDKFLSNHKGQWFTKEELAKELNITETDVMDAFYELKFRFPNWLLGRYQSKYFRSADSIIFCGPHQKEYIRLGRVIYRKRW